MAMPLPPLAEMVFWRMTETWSPPMRLSWALPSMSTPLPPFGNGHLAVGVHADDVFG